MLRKINHIVLANRSSAAITSSLSHLLPLALPASSYPHPVHQCVAVRNAATATAAAGKRSSKTAASAASVPAVAAEGTSCLCILVDLAANLFPQFWAYKKQVERGVIPPRDKLPLEAVVQDKMKELVRSWYAVPAPKRAHNRQVFLCLDRCGAQIRREELPSYKEGREPDEEAIEFLSLATDALSEMKNVIMLPTQEMGNFPCEADDVIATACDTLSAQGHPCVVVSHDKDLFQLIDSKKGIFYYQLRKHRMLEETLCKEEMGVPPELILDYLTMTGDEIDCVPGVPGIGPKKAVVLLNHFGSYNAVVAAAKEVTKKFGPGAKGEKSLDKAMKYVATRRPAAKKAAAQGKAPIDVFEGTDLQGCPPIVDVKKFPRMNGKIIYSIVSSEKQQLRMREKVLKLRQIPVVADNIGAELNEALSKSTNAKKMK